MDLSGFESMNPELVTPARPLQFVATEKAGTVSALMCRPEKAQWLLLLAHGAGAGMEHAFMESITAALFEVDIATFRYQFPYRERGKRFPDAQRTLLATVESAVAAASEAAPELRLLAGGKSMGGRMTSLLAAQSGLPRVQGLVFLGFPLHAPGRGDIRRAGHLPQIEMPMLFLQGSRDRLADLTLLEPICEQLGDRATLHVVESADHSFHVPRKSGKTDPEILEQLASAIAAWTAALLPPGHRD